jgi:hypothetical protein
MIGLLSRYSNIFLYIMGAAMLIGYGLPLIFFTRWWAKLFGWTMPEEKKLPVFLGQSLGILLTVISVFAFLAAGMPEVKPFFYTFILAILAGMTLLHIYGALCRLQPRQETLEIILWVILFVMTLMFYPAGV